MPQNTKYEKVASSHICVTAFESQKPRLGVGERGPNPANKQTKE